MAVDDYASVGDLRQHWRDLPAEREEEAAQKLFEASVEIRGNYPDLDYRISIPVADGGMDPAVPRLVACRMVKRAMDISEDAPPTGYESIQQSAGGVQFTGKLSNPDGNLYLTAADRRMLGRSKPRGKAWTIHPGGL